MQNVKDEVFLKKLGARIRDFRKSRNLTQVGLSVLCDIYAEQIGRIERGKLNVSICTLKILAKALKVTLPELVDVGEGG